MQKTSNSNKRFSPSLAILSSGGIYAAAAALGVASPLLGALCLIGASLGLNELINLLMPNKIEKFCHKVGLQVDGEFPRVIGTEERPDGYTAIVSLPCGLSIKAFEKYQAELESYLEGAIELSSDKNHLKIDVCNAILKERYEYEALPSVNPLEICIGYSRKGPYFIDIEDAPHILIAGATGAGKSVLLRSMITSLITQKNGVELNLADFQRVELSIFSRCSAVKSFCATPEAFSTLLAQMREESARRLAEFDKADCVNIKEYNRRRKNKYSYIVNIIDEFAALSEPEYKSILQELKIRVAQDRKCGIHYIICTQRPSVDIISGSIKANIPMRICLQTSSETDSRVVLDAPGAEKLRGKGHALVRSSRLEEIQTMYLSEVQARNLCRPYMVEKPKQLDEKPVNGGVKRANGSRSQNSKIC